MVADFMVCHKSVIFSKCISGAAVGAAIIAARGVYALHDYCLHRDSRWRY